MQDRSPQAHHSCVVSKFYDGAGGVDGGAVMCEDSEEHWAQHTALLGAYVQDEGGGDVDSNSHFLWTM